MVLFLLASALAVVLSVAIRWTLTRRKLDAAWEPEPEELAYAAGGRRRAVLAALAALRGEQAISITLGGTLETDGALPAGASPLSSDIYRAAARGTNGRKLTGNQDVFLDLGEMRDRLVHHGWLLSGRRRLVIAVAVGLPLFAAASLGAVRDVGPFAILPAAVAVVLMCTVRARSRAAGAELKKRRADHAHLAPGTGRGLLTTYGAAAAGMATALFGPAVVRESDRWFAYGLGVWKPGIDWKGIDWKGRGDSSCGGGASCGGGSCGGGGCGS